MQCLRGAAHRHSYFCKELTDDVEAEVLETASGGACQSSNRADNARESKVTVRPANAADGARPMQPTALAMECKKAKLRNGMAFVRVFITCRWDLVARDA